MMCTTMGSTNAAVLPLPVLAMPCAAGVQVQRDIAEPTSKKHGADGGACGERMWRTREGGTAATTHTLPRPSGGGGGGGGGRAGGEPPPPAPGPRPPPPPASAHQHIASAQSGGQRLRLDGSGLLEAGPGNGGGQRRVKAALCERLHGAGGVEAADAHAQLAAVVGHLRRYSRTTAHFTTVPPPRTGGRSQRLRH
jgi:hypothetical protein